MSALAVTLTVEQLAELVKASVREELAKSVPGVAPEVLTLGEAAKFLKRHPRQITRLIHEEALPAHYISEREPRFKRSELLAWLDSRPSKPTPTEAA